MAEYIKKDILQLIKRIGDYLSIKITKLFNTQDFRSFWAIAGFAVAVYYTWRVFRKPSGSQRRQPKPRGSGINSNQNQDLLPSEDTRAQSANDEFFQPANATLGQIVREKLSDGRKVTCRLLGVILVETTPEELQNQATVKSSVLEVLLEITKCSDLYLMERVLDDESQTKVLTALENAGIFTFGGLVKDKVLFCSTESGRMSFVRQLEPDWHIDSSPEISSQLARFIRHQLHISTNPERIASNVFSASSLEQFFSV